jgi:hypothetical protein
MKRGLNHDDLVLDANKKLIAIISKEIGFQGIQASAFNSFSNALETCNIFNIHVHVFADELNSL